MKWIVRCSVSSCQHIGTHDRHSVELLDIIAKRPHPMIICAYLKASIVYGCIAFRPTGYNVMFTAAFVDTPSVLLMLFHKDSLMARKSLKTFLKPYKWTPTTTRLVTQRSSLRLVYLVTLRTCVMSVCPGLLLCSRPGSEVTTWRNNTKGSKIRGTQRKKAQAYFKQFSFYIIAYVFNMH